MSFKDSLQGRLEKLADEVVPQLQGAWKDVRKRLDELNCSLANRAVPEHRRSKVSELSLRQKAEQAGQGRSNLKVVKSSRKTVVK
ncbi:hypothetical protein QQF73_06785 [Marinobacter sp. M216]|uniref:Uncharacterized protein n=1 Tax=Marinobacter albus TaxID=3030833 RepID=A0ABT7HBR9_9GAMM|nr:MULTISPECIES: hypothetical protein [unclassified Marinobacter]MBW7470405.1 hypothetical protein [Marinobacter sp. F4218]MDK9557330.1 hypothetical protein [Marinobacter sp. M216]